MKSFSPIKSFTPVMFFLVMCFTMISWGNESCEGGSKSSCQKQLCNDEKIKYLVDDCRSNLKTDNTATGSSSSRPSLAACEAEALNTCLAKNCSGCADPKDNSSSCKSATDELEKTLDDATNVCSSLTNRTKTTSKSQADVNDCSKKIEQCDEMNRKAYSGNTGNPEEQQNAFRDILSGTLGGLSGMLGGNAGSNSSACMEDYSTEANDKAEKEYKDDKKALEDDMNKIQKDIIDEEKDQNEKLVKIEKDINELNKDNEEKIRSLDKEMRERLKANSDSLIESGKKVRDLNKKMLAIQKSVKRINFNFKNTESERASQKIALQCNQAIQTAKRCMLDAYQNKNTLGAEICKDVPKVQSRGTKATAEFKILLQSISDTCYERLNADKANKEYENQQAIENANEEMTELQAQLQDEQSVQQNAQNDLQKISQESEREKNELATALAKELEALSKEQMSITQSSQKNIADMQRRIQDLQNKIAELDVRRKIKAKSATKIARTAVAKSSRAYEKAQSECGCTDKEEYKNLSVKAKEVCDKMINPEKIGVPKPKETKPKKASPDKSVS